MKMKRNIFSVLIAAVLAVVFAGCSNMVEELKVQDTTTFITPGSYTITDGETANTYTITKTLVTKNGLSAGAVDSNGKVTINESDINYEITLVKDGTLTIDKKTASNILTYTGKFTFKSKEKATLKNTANESDTIDFEQNGVIGKLPDGKYKIDNDEYTISGNTVTKSEESVGNVDSTGIVTIETSSKKLEITVFEVNSEVVSVELVKTVIAESDSTTTFYRGGAFENRKVTLKKDGMDGDDTVVIELLGTATSGNSGNSGNSGTGTSGTTEFQFEHGKITLTYTTTGAAATLTATADEGYELGTVSMTAGGTKVQLTIVEKYVEYSFIMPSGTLAVDATFITASPKLTINLVTGDDNSLEGKKISYIIRSASDYSFGFGFDNTSVKNNKITLSSRDFVIKDYEGNERTVEGDSFKILFAACDSYVQSDVPMTVFNSEGWEKTLYYSSDGTFEWDRQSAKTVDLNLTKGVDENTLPKLTLKLNAGDGVDLTGKKASFVVENESGRLRDDNYWEILKDNTLCLTPVNLPYITSENKFRIRIAVVDPLTHTSYNTDVIRKWNWGDTLYYRSGETLEWNQESSVTKEITLRPGTYQPTGLEIPLTFEAKEDGTEVTYHDDGSGHILTYKINNKSDVCMDNNFMMFDYGEGKTVTLNAGDYIQFYAYAKSDGYETYSSTRITSDKDCYVYGNVMSLVNADDFETETEIPDFSHNTISYFGIFQGNEHLINHETKDIYLPATTLRPYCYNCMFEGCKKLTRAPKLPATTLAEACYTTMFGGCESLQTAPELPAKVLPKACYSQMFSGCKNLNYIKCLATEISTEGIIDPLDNWLGQDIEGQGVSATGTFIRDASMSSVFVPGAYGIPTGWTVEDAPTD